MLDFIKTEERNLVDDLAIESEMNLPNSFDDLKPWQFPLFVTVKRLIYMMDACLAYSFFSRDNTLLRNNNWHLKLIMIFLRQSSGLKLPTADL